MNCPWFLNPIDALLRLIPPGSMGLIFPFNCGFDAIFAAIGLNVVLDVVPLVDDMVEPPLEVPLGLFVVGFGLIGADAECFVIGVLDGFVIGVVEGPFAVGLPTTVVGFVASP